MKHISIVVPVYNEQENIPLFAAAIKNTMEPLPYTYTLLFVNDGSADNTLNVIKETAAIHPIIHYISFSRNFGHQNALKAGLDHAKGDAVICMDGDLQHPPEMLPLLLQKYEEGNDVVYTIRKEDEKLSFFKRQTSRFFYGILNRFSDVKVEPGSADFRLMSSKVVNVLKSLPESDLFYRGLVKWAGFKQVSIEYNAASRSNGKSKYTLKKMVRLAMYGILAFSTKPIYYAVYLGLTFSTLSFLYIPYTLYSYFSGHAISGWASVIVTIAFFGGLNLMVLGIVGLYIGRIFMQSKNRPLYIIDEATTT